MVKVIGQTLLTTSSITSFVVSLLSGGMSFFLGMDLVGIVLGQDWVTEQKVTSDQISNVSMVCLGCLVLFAAGLYVQVKIWNRLRIRSKKVVSFFDWLILGVTVSILIWNFAHTVESYWYVLPFPIFCFVTSMLHPWLLGRDHKDETVKRYSGVFK